MSLRLILMRHAKSDWGGDIARDFDRPLSKRGRKGASAIGTWLATHEFKPEAVLCSSAKRTRETWALVNKELKSKPVETYTRQLYLAAPEQMLMALAGLHDCRVAMMVAHNPGVAILMAALSDCAPAHARFEGCPTGATTVLEFDTDDWSAITPSKGQVVDFVVPHDLI